MGTPHLRVGGGDGGGPAYDGTDEIQRIIIVRNLLKGYVKLGDFL
ncbi:MAG: hypothetical protein ACOYEF_14260 [Planifilum sp.]